MINLGRYIHDKTGNFYWVTDVRKDCTNDRVGKWSVSYQSEPHGGILYSRELEEFKSKFTYDA